MGLDNGIVLYTKQKLEQKDLCAGVEFVLDNKKDEKSFYSYDICYWRKCFGLRRSIVNCFDRLGILNENDTYELNTQAISDIITKLCSILAHPYEWDESDSIWTLNELSATFAIDIINLAWLQKFLLNHSASYAIFYDSY